MPKIVPDQTLVAAMTTGIAGGVTAALAGINEDHLAIGTLRPDHLDHFTRGRSYYKQSNPGVTAVYPQSVGFTILNHGLATSSFAPAFQFTQPWCIVRSRLTVEIIEGSIDPATGVDTVTFRPRIVGNALAGGVQYPWNQGPGNTDGLRFGVSRHNPGQTPSTGASDAGLIAYAQQREIANRTMTFAFWWPVQNSTPGSPAEVSEVYWDLGVEAADVTFGRFSLDLRLDLL